MSDILTSCSRREIRARRSVIGRPARAVPRIVAGAVTGFFVLVAAPGWAHVTIDPGTAVQGGDAALSFHVPSESASATTTKVQIFMPQDHPIASVSVKPLPGWHSKVVTKKLSTPLSSDDGQVTEAVSSITWTPDSKQDALKPGQYDDFDVSVGPLPKVSSLTFKALQTYSDGSVVRWIDPPAPRGQPEPEHPAPTLVLVPAADQPAGDTGSGADSGSGSSDATATTALVLSIVAILLGLGALASSLLRRRPR